MPRAPSVATFVPTMLLAAALPAQQHASMFEAGRVTIGEHAYPFRLLPPATIAPATNYPLVVFLHGAGERGDDNEHQLHWLPRTLAEPANRAAFPCFVLAVQCPTAQRWVEVPWDAAASTPMAASPSPAIAAVIAAMAQVQHERPVDASRVYLTGLSMGGYGTFDLACRHPEWFAAVAPICGGGDERQAARLVGVPMQVWHGGADRVVPVARSRTMVEALRQAGGDVDFRELAGVGHDSWKQAYGPEGLLPWLFAQRRAPLPIAPLVPWPDVVEPAAGPGFRPGAAVQIDVIDDEARVHGAHFAAELATLTGAQVRFGTDDASVSLGIDGLLAAGGYALTIGPRVTVTGGDVRGLAAGTSALLQCLRRGQDGWLAPAATIAAAPAHEFCGVLVDCARHFQSVTTLRRLIELCRLCRVPQLVLHLSDHEAFRFPSARFPELASEAHYSREELLALVACADAAGVTLVPELDVPGHASAMVKARPDLFGLNDHARHGGVVNLGRESTRAAVSALFGELAEVFASSPWLHIGGDEVDLTGVADDPDCRAALQALGSDDPQELCRDFVRTMHGAVKALGRRTLVWEGFARGGKVPMPKDLTVIAWESAYYPPDQLVADGYEIVNASWQPLYVVGGGRLLPHAAPRRWHLADIHRWQPRRFEHFLPGMPSFAGIELPASAKVRGAMMCVWEQADGTAVAHLRERLPAFAERTWQATDTRGLADLAARTRDLAPLLDALLPPGPDGDVDEWAALQRSGPPRVHYRLFRAPREGLAAVPDFATQTAFASGTLPLLRGGPLAGPLGVSLTATLQVPARGDYTFRLEACDGPARLLLGGQLVCDHARRGDWSGTEATVTLDAGEVALHLDAAQGPLHTLCRVSWRTPGASGFTLVDDHLKPLR